MVGTIDLYLLTETPLIEAIIELESHNIIIEEGPIYPTGATHRLNSVYIQDPDQTLLK